MTRAVSLTISGTRYTAEVLGSKRYGSGDHAVTELMVSVGGLVFPVYEHWTERLPEKVVAFKGRD